MPPASSTSSTVTLCMAFTSIGQLSDIISGCVTGVLQSMVLVVHKRAAQARSEDAQL